MNKENKISQELITTFLENKSISEDKSIYDNKHKEIISKVDLTKDLSKFRNWNLQNDMGLKYKIGLIPKFFLGQYKSRILSLVIKITNKRINHYFEYSSLLDDIDVIINNDGKFLLDQNPQNETPGATDFPRIKGYSVSARWLRYLYFLLQIKKHNLIDKNSIWIDLGSYYGGLQGLVKKYHPDVKMILVDFEHQLIRSYIYLKTLYPNSKHIFPNQVKTIKDFKNLDNGSIVYIDQKDFNSIKDLNVDLFTNFFSLGEMKKVTFDNYINSQIYQSAKKVYLANRFSSSPYFDNTYDDNINIFDYNNKNTIIHFDVLPINHYQISFRKLFNREFFRNTSSPYFEKITKA
jgi:putative sugar O-methyltransferase